MEFGSPRETWLLDTVAIGPRVLIFEQVASTNDVAAQLAARGEQDGTIILANHQTAGRGQPGRSWLSPADASILMSVILHPPEHLRRPAFLCAWAGVAVCAAIAELTGVQPMLKWPNDVLVMGRKICGLLVEQGRATIVGLGINVHQSQTVLAAEGLVQATSLACHAAEPPDRRAVVHRLASHLDRRYLEAKHGNTTSLMEEWHRFLGLMNHRVRVQWGAELKFGILRRLDYDQLEIETEQGMVSLSPEQIRHLSRQSGPLEKN